MKKKLTPHIIAVNALVVFIVLGLACASAPETPPQNFKPPMPLTQNIMLLTDPRMPLDLYSSSGRISQYWLGTIRPENTLDKLGFLELQGFYIYDLFIDETKIKSNHWGSVGLSPGKHTVLFSYKGRIFEDISGTTKAKSDYADVDISNIKIEFNVQSGEHYHITDKLYQSAREASLRTVHGWTNTKANVIFAIEPQIVFRMAPAVQLGIKGSFDKPINAVYLEPYDSNVPLESQSFLEMRFGIYVVSFNGSTVSWGGGKNDHVTIGIPAGKCELQLADLDKNLLYMITIDALPQRRYYAYVNTDGKIILADQTIDNNYFIATEIGEFTRPK